MRKSTTRCFPERALALFSFLAVLAAATLPAKAVPVDAYFDGQPTQSFPQTNFGVSETQALMLEGSFDVPIVERTFDYIGSTVGAVAISQSLESFTPIPPTSSDNRASSEWTVQNVSGTDLQGATYLLFTSSSPFVAGGETVDYVDSNVGVTIDADLGWVLIKVAGSSSDDFYYPAIMLDRSVANPLAGLFPNDGTELLTLNYVVNQALVDAPSGSNDYQLPLLNVGLAFAEVPEPTTASLLSLGLVALALRRRRS